MPVGGRILVPLITLPGGAVTGLPKGRLERGETAAQAACREVREETGLLGSVIEPLGEISYWFWAQAERGRVQKRVEFFLLLYRSGSPAHHHPVEVEHVRLVPIEDAEAGITHSGERAMMRAARGRVGDLIDDGFLPLAGPPARARLATVGGA